MADEPPRTEPEASPEGDTESEDEIQRFTAMDEASQWFEIEASHVRYPERMRDKRGEKDENVLLAYEQMSDTSDKEDTQAAAEAKKVLKKRLKKERRAAAETTKKI